MSFVKKLKGKTEETTKKTTDVGKVVGGKEWRLAKKLGKRPLM